jgi:putative thioredoxin
MAIAGSFGIRSLPTVVLFKNGRPVDGFMGAQPEGAIRALLAKHLGAEAPEPEPEAELAEEEGEDLGALIAALQTQIQAEPQKHELKAELADLLLRAGALDEAVRVLDALPQDAQDSDAAKRARARLGFAQAAVHAPSAEELQAIIARDGGNLLARYQLGAMFLLAGHERAALDQFLTILKTDRSFDEDLGRRKLIEAFRVVRDEDLIGEYRRKMASLLF